jgi:hypothetical protein
MAIAAATIAPQRGADRPRGCSASRVALEADDLAAIIVITLVAITCYGWTSLWSAPRAALLDERVCLAPSTRCVINGLTSCRPAPVQVGRKRMTDDKDPAELALRALEAVYGFVRYRLRESRMTAS